MPERIYSHEEVSVPEAVVRVLEEVGVDAVFGMPGGYTLKLFDALYDHQDSIRTILVREESLAGVMAEVYGRLTGRPGVVIGQGAFLLSNALLGTLEAHLGSSPMVLLTDMTDAAPYSHHAPYQAGTGAYGSWDARAAFGAVTRWTAVVSDPGSAVQTTQLAVKHALTGSPGPVAVLFHSDALDARVSAKTAPRIYPSRFYMPLRAQADPSALAVATEILAGARSPVILAGNGVRIAQAYDELRDLAEMLEAPVATTAGGKGVFAETHPLALGVFGNFGRPLANAVTASADVILAVGTRLSPTDTANEHPRLIDPERQTLLQLDVDARHVGWTFPVDHALVADAKVGLAQLVSSLSGVHLVDAAGRAARLKEQRAAHGWFDVPASTSDEVPIAPQRLIKELQAALPEDAIVTCDAGENRLFMLHYFQTKGAGTFLQPAATGGMGYAIPAALSAKVVDPSRAAVAVCGDGGFGMAMNGLMTAIESRLPIIVVVMNNSALGWVLHGQDHRPIASSFGQFDHAAIAEAMGCRGIRVEAPGELPEAFELAFGEDRPVVIDVVTSSEETYKTVSSDLTVTAE
jgi:acetolactate synthase I/II/III large subunit